MSTIELTGRNMAGLLDGFQHIAKSPKNRDLPLLKAVQLIADETSVTVLATDRFIAARRTVERVEPGEPVEFTLTATALDEVLRVVKPKQAASAIFGLSLDGGMVTLTEYGIARLAAPVASGEYPRVDTVIDKAHTSEAEAVPPLWAFDTAVLTRMAALGCKGGNVELRLPAKVGPALGFTIPAWGQYPETVGAVMPRRSA